MGCRAHFSGLGLEPGFCARFPAPGQRAELLGLTQGFGSCFHMCRSLRLPLCLSVPNPSLPVVPEALTASSTSPRDRGQEHTLTCPGMSSSRRQAFGKIDGLHGPLGLGSQGSPFFQAHLCLSPRAAPALPPAHGVWGSLGQPDPPPAFPPGQFLTPACAQALGFCQEAWERGQGSLSPSLHGLLVPPAASPPPPRPAPRISQPPVDRQAGLGEEAGPGLASCSCAFSPHQKLGPVEPRHAPHGALPSQRPPLSCAPPLEGPGAQGHAVDAGPAGGWG